MKPTTRSITLLDGGRTLGPYVSNVLSPGYNAARNTVLGIGGLTNTASPLFLRGIQFDDVSRPVRYIDGGTSVAFFQRNPVLFAPAQTIPGQAFIGTVDGKIQGVIILCPDKGRVFRQGYLTARQGEAAVGRNGIPGGCHIMKHQILRSICIVVELGTDQPGILPQGSKRDVRIQLILPNQL